MSSNPNDKRTASVAPTAYSKFILRLWFTRNWIWIVLPLCIAASLAFVSIEIALCIIIILAVAIPMVMALVYYSLVLSHYSVYSVTNKSVLLATDGISLSFPESTNIKNKKISYSDIREVYLKDNLIAIAIKGSNYTFLLLPQESFSQHEIHELALRVRNANQ